MTDVFHVPVRDGRIALHVFRAVDSDTAFDGDVPALREHPRIAVAVVTNFDERLPAAQQRLQRDDRTGEIHGCEAHDIQEGGAAAAHNIVAIGSVGQGYRIDTAGGEECRHPVDLGVAEIPDLRERSK